MAIQIGQALMIGAGLALSGVAHGQFYACGPWLISSPTPALYEIDPSNAQTTEIGTGAYFAASGMTYDGERILMATTTTVHVVNPETGGTTLLHSFGDQFTLTEGATAADPGSGELILINKSTFAIMDLDTGLVDVVYEDGVGLDLSGATFDDQGRLWAVYLNGSQSQIAQINPETGVRMTLDVLALPFAAPSVGGMAFDSDSDQMLVISGSNLVNVSDPSSPVVIGNVGVPRMSGLVYVPQMNSCVADINNDGSLDFFDVSAFLVAFSSMDPTADLTGDASFDFFDVSAFLTAFGNGCP